jgi:D-alanyl-lipoteichoic acid acyltransferase DltB (MBOAT superfamily)
MGGNRVAKGRVVFNLFIVWFLTGIWHGANWTFIVWGIFYFLLIAIEHFIDIKKKLRFFSHIYTMLFVIIGWVIFRSASLAEAGRYLGMMFGYHANGLTDEIFFLYLSNSKCVLLVAILLSTPIASICKKKLMLFNVSIYKFMSGMELIIVSGLSLLVCIKSGYNPFIYFNF